MRTKEAAAGGTAVRLHLIAAWREVTVSTEAERAAPSRRRTTYGRRTRSARRRRGVGVRRRPP
ncbi:hypothetical protein [Streptomyces sp. NPDC052015]